MGALPRAAGRATSGTLTGFRSNCSKSRPAVRTGLGGEHRPRRGVRGPLPGAEQRRQDPLADAGAGGGRRRARGLGRGDQRHAGDVACGRFVVGAAPGTARHRAGSPDVAGAVDAHARRDLLGWQWRHRDASGSAPRHGVCGTSKGRHRGPVPVGHVGRPATRSAARVCQYHLRTATTRSASPRSSPASGIRATPS